MYKIVKAIKSPKIAAMYILNLKISRIIPDKLYLKLKYKLLVGKNLDFINCSTFSEKLQWLKIYDRKPEYTKMTDKYEVRKYISDILGEEYLIPLLGVYDNFDEIDFNALPDKFVLKPNHTSGNIYICKDKSKIDFKKLKKLVYKWLKRRYYWYFREWPYKNVRPRILCEKYMADDDLGTELTDYKLLCFNGKFKCLTVCKNRASGDGLNIDFYDKNWVPMTFEINSASSGAITPKPVNFDKMAEFAEILSKDLPFVRVDFYESDKQLYFGELTFYPGAGFVKFNPDFYDDILGSWIKLPGQETK